MAEIFRKDVAVLRLLKLHSTPEVKSKSPKYRCARSKLITLKKHAKDVPRVTSFQQTSPLPQTLLLVAQQRGQQVFDHAALSGLDLDRHRHARRELDQAVVNHHVGS